MKGAFEVSITVTGRPGAIRVSWSWAGGRFEHAVPAAPLDRLTLQRESLTRSLWRGEHVGDQLRDIGRALGELFVGGEHQADVLDALDAGRQGFVLCSVEDGQALLPGVPWEALILPGRSAPLLFDAPARGAAEWARSAPPGTQFGGRRPARKCLAAWSESLARDLLAGAEVDELRKRMIERQDVRFRWVVNPDLTELRARLRLECALFLYAGHGEFDGASYRIELRSGAIDTASLLDDLRVSKAEVLVFDSCDSGLVNAGAGLPRMLPQLADAKALVGMQGPANDMASSCYMPTLVEALLLGDPVWTCVNQLRRLLFDQGSDAWFTPVLYLKPGYRPLDPAPEIGNYLDDLRKAAAARAPRRQSPGS